MARKTETVIDDENLSAVRRRLVRIRAFFRTQANVLIKVAIDLALLSAAYVLAFVLRFESGLDERLLRSLYSTLPFVLVVKVVLLVQFRAYRGIYKYASTQDLLGLVKASCIGSVVAIAVPGWLNVEQARSVFVIDWLLSIVLLGGARFATRLFTEQRVFEPLRRASENGSGTSGGRSLGVIASGVFGRARVFRTGTCEADRSARGKIALSPCILDPGSPRHLRRPQYYVKLPRFPRSRSPATTLTSYS